MYKQLIESRTLNIAKRMCEAFEHLKENSTQMRQRSFAYWIDSMRKIKDVQATYWLGDVSADGSCFSNYIAKQTSCLDKFIKADGKIGAKWVDEDAYAFEVEDIVGMCNTIADKIYLECRNVLRYIPYDVIYVEYILSADLCSDVFSKVYKRLNKEMVASQKLKYCGYLVTKLHLENSKETIGYQFVLLATGNIDPDGNLINLSAVAPIGFYVYKSFSDTHPDPIPLIDKYTTERTATHLYEKYLNLNLSDEEINKKITDLELLRYGPITNTAFATIRELTHDNRSPQFGPESLLVSMGLDIWPTIMLFKLLSCKNIVSVKENPLDSIVNKKKKRRFSKTVDQEHSVIKLVLPGEKQVHKDVSKIRNEPTGRTVSVRAGHFKTYTKDKPLFGRNVGTYWWNAIFKDGAKCREYDVDVKGQDHDRQ